MGGARLGGQPAGVGLETLPSRRAARRVRAPIPDLAEGCVVEVVGGAHPSKTCPVGRTARVTGPQAREVSRPTLRRLSQRRRRFQGQPPLSRAATTGSGTTGKILFLKNDDRRRHAETTTPHHDDKTTDQRPRGESRGSSNRIETEAGARAKASPRKEKSRARRAKARTKGVAAEPSAVLFFAWFRRRQP